MKKTDKIDRKKFIRKSIWGLGSIVAIPTVFSSCSKADDLFVSSAEGSCTIVPNETAGPYRPGLIL